MAKNDPMPPPPKGPCPQSPNGQHDERPEGHDMVCRYCGARRQVG